MIKALGICENKDTSSSKGVEPQQPKTKRIICVPSDNHRFEALKTCVQEAAGMFAAFDTSSGVFRAARGKIVCEATASVNIKQSCRLGHENAWRRLLRFGAQDVFAGTAFNHPRALKAARPKFGCIWLRHLHFG